MIRKLLLLAIIGAWLAPSSWATTIASDTMTEAADTDLDSHTPDVGTGWTEASAATMTVIALTDKLRLSSTADSTIRRAREGTNVVSANMDISADCQVASGASGRRTGVLGRMTTADFDNEYAAYAEGSSGTQCVINLHKNVGGSVSSLGTYTHTYAGGDDEEVLAIKLEIRSAAKKVYLAAVERISSADDSLTSNTYAGVYGSWNVSRLDNYLSVDAPADTQRRVILMSKLSEWIGRLLDPPSAYAVDTRVLGYYESPVTGAGTPEDPRRPLGLPFEMADGPGSVQKVFKADWVLLHDDGTTMTFKVFDQPERIAKIDLKYLKTKDTLSKKSKDYMASKGEGRIDGR